MWWTKVLDWTDFSDPVSGFDLVRNTVAQTSLADGYHDQDRFYAVALTTGHPMGSVEAVGQGFADSGGANAAKYIFKARILGPNSPHLFLPDPCLLSQATDTAAAMNAIYQHTTFFGAIDSGGDTAYTINPGDIVEVELERGWFSYNLEKGLFIEVVFSRQSGANATNNAACADIGSLFGSLTPAGVGFSGGGGAVFKCKESPCPPKDDPTFAKCKPPTYPNLPKKSTDFFKYSESQVISAIKASGQSESIQKIMWAIIKKEQPKFSFPANNVAGIQLDGKRGFAGASESSFDYQTCFRDSGGDQRIFAGFDTLEKGMKVFGNIIQGKMSVFKSLPGSSPTADADIMTWNYYRSWNTAFSPSELTNLKSTGQVTRGARTYERNWNGTKSSFASSFTKWQSA